MCLLDKSHNIDTFLHKNGETSKFVVGFLLDRNTFLRKTESVDVFVEQFLQKQRQTHENVEDFACETQNF